MRVSTTIVLALAHSVCAWPHQRMGINGGGPNTEGRGVDMIVYLGFAGMGYCPQATMTTANGDGQGTLLEWIFGAPDHTTAIKRLSHTLGAYESKKSTFLSEAPHQHKAAYLLTGDVRTGVLDQFGKMGNVAEKMGYCLTAMAAALTGRPVLGGRMVQCDTITPECHVRPGTQQNTLTRGNVLKHDKIVVQGVPLPHVWPEFNQLFDTGSIKVVRARHWGLQAIVAQGQVPVVKGNRDGTAGKLHWVQGINVMFRGTTSFSNLHFLAREARETGQGLPAKGGSAVDIANENAYHQWSMNKKVRLVDALLKTAAKVDADGHVTALALTHEGISEEAALLVLGRQSDDDVVFSVYFVDASVHHRPSIYSSTGSGPVDGDVCDAVVDLAGGMAGHGPVPVFVTGHSKGGALSILGGYLLQRCLRSKGSRAKVATVVSAEGPRTGNGKWVREFLRVMRADDVAGWKFNVFRVLKKNDPVGEQPLSSKTIYRHVPGLLSVPVVTVLDDGIQGKVPAVKLPPVFSCDNSQDINDLIRWDQQRRQRGYRTVPENQRREEDKCTFWQSKTMNIDEIEGGRLEGMPCTLCSGTTEPDCEELDYQQNGDDDQYPLNPFTQSLADRAQLAHPFFGPTFALCPARKGEDAMVPRFGGGSSDDDKTISQDALSFVGVEEGDLEKGVVRETTGHGRINPFHPAFRGIKSRDGLALQP